jgi:phospholipid/cholesterol/gamma-HCH transport system substrate-binding protein
VETEAKYVTVGIFILIALALGIGFVLWYSNARDGRSYNAYEIYFTGSVSGLDQGGVVRYLGVEVGRVRRLTINRTDSTPRVKVIAEIDSEAPISSATRASLSMQGVTGLLFINLKEAPESDSHGELPMGEKYPVIQSVTSDLDALLASLPTLVGRATVLIDRVSTVFSDDNLKALNSTVSNLQASTQNLPQTAAKVSSMIDEMRNRRFSKHCINWIVSLPVWRKPPGASIVCWRIAKCSWGTSPNTVCSSSSGCCVTVVLPRVNSVSCRKA